MKTEKDLPRNIEAETTLLGEVLTVSELLSASELKPDDFFAKSHRAVFKAMCALAGRNVPIDLITLSDYLKDSGEIDSIGGYAFLAGLTVNAIGGSMIPYHAAIIKRESVKRQIIEYSSNIKNRLNDENVPEIINEMRSFGESLSHVPMAQSIEYFSYQSLLKQGKAYADKGKDTGFKDLDAVVKIMPGELDIVGARSRHGKSTFSYNVALNLLESHPDEAVIFFNLDVPTTVMMARFATIWSAKHFPQTGSYGYKNDVLTCFKNEDFPETIRQAFEYFNGLGESKRLIVESRPRTAEEIISHAERVSKERPLGAVFIDYMELIKSDKDRDSEELRLSHIVNTLRIGSERLSCPVIALAQMNRESVKSKRKIEQRRPVLEGLRYSGRQEQEATTVLGLFNIEAETLEMLEEPKNYFDEQQSKATLEVIPLKNRGGLSNKIITLGFDMKSGLIYSQPKSTFRGR